MKFATLLLTLSTLASASAFANTTYTCGKAGTKAFTMAVYANEQSVTIDGVEVTGSYKLGVSSSGSTLLTGMVGGKMAHWMRQSKGEISNTLLTAQKQDQSEAKGQVTFDGDTYDCE